MKIPTIDQVAFGFERAARLAAPVIALLITCLLLAVELAYRLGYLTGEALHARNHQMAAAWRRLWVHEADVLDKPAAAIRLILQMTTAVAHNFIGEFLG